MSKQNKELVRYLFGELDKGNTAILMELCTPDFEFHPPGSFESLSLNAAIQFVESYYKAFPDYTHRIEDVIAEADKMVLRFVCSGTHKGEYRGIPATGRSFKYGEIFIARIAGGKITEAWAQEDTPWMMEQLGLELKPKEIST